MLACLPVSGGHRVAVFSNRAGWKLWESYVNDLLDALFPDLLQPAKLGITKIIYCFVFLTRLSHCSTVRTPSEPKDWRVLLLDLEDFDISQQKRSFWNAFFGREKKEGVDCGVERKWFNSHT